MRIRELKKTEYAGVKPLTPEVYVDEAWMTTVSQTTRFTDVLRAYLNNPSVIVDTETGKHYRAFLIYDPFSMTYQPVIYQPVELIPHVDRFVSITTDADGRMFVRTDDRTFILTPKKSK